MVKHLYIVDSRISNYQSLIDQSPADSVWYVLDPEQDGINQIMSHVSSFDLLDSLHIISHGSEGTLYLGSAVLTTDQLNTYSNQLAEISDHLAETADIFLYGCNVAAGDDGEAFVNQLSQLTGADVAASDDLTGDLSLGGDSVLEVTTAEINVQALDFTDFGALLDVVGIMPLNAQLNEGDSGTTPFTFNLTLSGTNLDGAAVYWAIENIDTDMADFDQLSGMIEFAPEETVKTISVGVSGDTDIEEDEAFQVYISDTSGVEIGRNSTATGTILNDDSAVQTSTVNIAAVNAQRAEGDSGTTAFTFNLTRSGDASNGAVVYWAIENIDTDAADFDRLSGMIEFAPEETVKIISVEVSGDSDIEEDESFEVYISDINGVVIGHSFKARGTILDDDTLLSSVISVTPLSAEQDEGNSGTTPFTFNVTRTGDNSGEVSVSWTLESIDTDSNDFGQLSTSGVVVLDVGEMQETITIYVAGDIEFEEDESFKVVLTGVSTTGVLVDAVVDEVLFYAEGKILNNDDGGDPSSMSVISVEPLVAQQTEGNSGTTPFSFRVIRSGDSSGEVVVSWVREDYETDSSDFRESSGFGTLVLVAGELEQTVTIDVLGDTKLEEDESFKLMITDVSTTGGPVDAVVDEDNFYAVETILNDDNTIDLGFIINGVDRFDWSGQSVSGAGDINGDGYEDLIIGAPWADPNELDRAGESYVIFGRAADFGSSFDLSSLDGTNGFVIKGIDAFDWSGQSVSGAGDVNGDGYDDLIIGAYNADANGLLGTGESYVVFGRSGSFEANLDLSTLNGINGFVLNGIDWNDYSGRSVSNAGDVNGDGYADLIIGAPGADPDNQASAGESYVIYGGASLAASLDLAALNGTNGFVMNGVGVLDQLGWSVSGAGDVDGDGYADLIIGAPGADPDNQASAGESYVIYGGASLAASLDLAALNGANGFVVRGMNEGDASGISVGSAGDINGDGYADLIIGAEGAQSEAGESYIVFGGETLPAILDLSALNGVNGFVVNGIDGENGSGLSVSGAGDVNADGYDDLIIGAPGVSPDGQNVAGESYVLFGHGGAFEADLYLTELDGTNGFAVKGMATGDSFGVAVSSAGDINSDGYADLIVGADGAESGAGQSFVIYGREVDGFRVYDDLVLGFA